MEKFNANFYARAHASHANDSLEWHPFGIANIDNLLAGQECVARGELHGGGEYLEFSNGIQDLRIEIRPESATCLHHGTVAGRVDGSSFCGNCGKEWNAEVCDVPEEFRKFSQEEYPGCDPVSNWGIKSMHKQFEEWKSAEDPIVRSVLRTNAKADAPSKNQNENGRMNDARLADSTIELNRAFARLESAFEGIKRQVERFEKSGDATDIDPFASRALADECVDFAVAASRLIS